MNAKLINFFGLYKEILFLLIIATLLGFYKLGERPLPANQDELSNIYDAYSLSKTSADRFGHKFPIVLEGFGNADYRPSLYAWLAVIPVKIAGLSVASGRSVSVICFVLSLLFLFLTSLKLFDKKFALLISIIFIFSPWSWYYARIAHEGAMLPSLFIILTLYSFIKIYTERQHGYLNFILLGFIIGFSTNAYQSSRLIALLISIIVFIYLFFERIEQKNKKLFLLVLFCFIAALPQIYILIYHPAHFFGRYDSVKLNNTSAFQVAGEIINNIYINLSAGFLFFKSDKANSLSISRFLEIESVFFYIGLVAIFKIKEELKNKTVLFILLLLIIAIIPCSLTDNNPNALRLSCMLIICPFFIAAGMYFFIQKISNSTIQNIVLFTTFVIIAVSFNIQYNRYKHHIISFDDNQQNNLVHLSEKLNTLYNKYDTVLFENSDNQPYIYFLFYCHIEPSTFQKMEKIHDNSEFYDFSKMGNFYFLSYESILKMEENNTSNNLIVSHSYPHTFNIQDSIVTPDKKVYYFSNKIKK